MTAQNALKALLDKKEFSSADKSKITKAYLSQFGKRPETETNCERCYHDALIQILAAQRKTPRLKAGEVVEFKGRFYNRHDELPPEIIKNNPEKLEQT